MYLEIFVAQGANLSYDLPKIRDVRTNTYVNIATHNFVGQLRKSPYSANASDNLIITKYNVASGGLTISLGSSNTAALTPMKYRFDVIGTSNNRSNTTHWGIIEITPGVTR